MAKIQALQLQLPPSHTAEPLPLMREMPPADPFPTDALGRVLSNAAIGIHDKTRAPIAICGQSVLAVATLATQAYANVALPTGQTRPLSNYFATVGVSGERKSAVDYEAMGPVRKREEALREAYDVEMFEYGNAFEAWDRARKHAVEKCKGAQGAIKFELDKLGPAPSEPLPLMEGRSNELAPRTAVLSSFARNRWIAYHDHIEGDLSGGLQAVRGLANKIPEIAARLAGVLALVDDLGAGEINDDSMERGAALTDHYLTEALRLFHGSQASAELLRAQELLRWLTAEWEYRPYVGLRHIYQLGPNAVRDSSKAKRLVEILVEHQQLVRIEGGADIGGTHCRDAWRIVGVGP